MQSTATADSQAEAASHSSPDSRGYVPGEAGMWFFVIGDLLIFGVYFVFYLISRSDNQALFLHGQQYLNQGIAVVNTVVLLTSSLLVALATEAARSRKQRDANRLMVAAFFVGALFPVLKLIEWIPKIQAGHTPGESLFFTYYYVMTGLHLCHVVLGLIILAVVIRELRVATQPRIKLLETGAIYWHMVDLLWLILLALLYLMR